jgi:hypothetical protein
MAIEHACIISVSIRETRRTWSWSRNEHDPCSRKEHDPLSDDLNTSAQPEEHEPKARFVKQLNCRSMQRSRSPGGYIQTWAFAMCMGDLLWPTGWLSFSGIMEIPTLMFSPHVLRSNNKLLLATWHYVRRRRQVLNWRLQYYKSIDTICMIS